MSFNIEIVHFYFFAAGAVYLLFGLVIWMLIDGRYPEFLGKLSKNFWVCGLVILFWPVATPLTWLVWLFRGCPCSQAPTYIDGFRF